MHITYIVMIDGLFTAISKTPAALVQDTLKSLGDGYSTTGTDTLTKKAEELRLQAETKGILEDAEGNPNVSTSIDFKLGTLDVKFIAFVNRAGKYYTLLTSQALNHYVLVAATNPYGEAGHDEDIELEIELDDKLANALTVAQMTDIAYEADKLAKGDNSSDDDEFGGVIIHGFVLD